MLIKVHPKRPERSIIAAAARILTRGGIVAFPTETVYGLGANAFDARAVRRIFAVKGRPRDNPLIVHIGRHTDLERVAYRISPLAKRLIDRFWPGPLTLILPKQRSLPRMVSGGRTTVAVRMPAHPVARALLTSVPFPIAAPSANRSGCPSPTRASHVLHDFGNRVELILDGGPTPLGIESTVIDLTTRPARLLRPGALPEETLTHLLPDLQIRTAKRGEAPKSPGLKYRHYAPETPLVLVTGNTARAIRIKLGRALRAAKKQEKRVGIMGSRELLRVLAGDATWTLGARHDLPRIARRLFDGMRELDTRKLDLIFAEGFPARGMGRAIMNRLRKAATRIL